MSGNMAKVWKGATKKTERVDRDNLATAVCALVPSHLDYCSALYMGLLLKMTQTFRFLQYFARAPYTIHMTLSSKEFQWPELEA